MLRIICILFMLFIPAGSTIVPGRNGEPIEADACEQLYTELGLSAYVGFDAFEQAYTGYGQIAGKKREILTLIDFTKPSTEERMFVIDMKQHKLLFQTHVAHGQNSGGNYATSFSNRNGSHQSSLGFYLTANTYIGKNGYSLILDGLEPGVNDNARARAVVIHAAAYANPSVIAGQGRLGRSHGCPALPEAVNRPVIDTIKDGSVLYIYAGDNRYMAQSTILSPAGNTGPQSAS